MRVEPVIQKRVLKARIQEIFEAWSTSDLLAKWFVCNSDWTASAECDFRIGGSYSIVMQSNGQDVGRAFGIYRKIDEPREIVMSWSSDGPVVVRDTLLTIELREVDAGTEITLTHNIDSNSAPGRAHAAGWIATLDNLANFLGAPNI